MLNCPVCKSSKFVPFALGWDSEYRSLEGKFRYNRCLNCEAVFMENPPVDRLKEIYPPNYYSFSDSASKSFLQKIKHFLEIRMFQKILNDLLGSIISALDVGGGSGWMLDFLKIADLRVKETHIVDIDATAREAAESRGHTFHCQRIEDYITDKKFDVILLLNILEHVANPTELIKKVAQLISPTGLILMKTPNVDTLDRVLFQRHNWGGLHCPRHWVLFNKKSLYSLVKQSGLEVANFFYTQGASQWTASILGWLADCGVISISRERPMHRHFLWAPLMAITAVFDFFRLPFSKTAQMFCVLRFAKN